MGFLPFLSPRLRLFLSADIVGSTAYKQQLASSPTRKEMDRVATQPEKLGGHFDSSMPSWLTPIANFYRAIDRNYAAAWHQYVAHAQSIKWPTGPAPGLWKGNGDEVIYAKELHDYREAFAGVYLWIQAVHQYRRVLRKQFPSLDVKATAWLSGFPLMNTEVIFYRQRPAIDEMDSGDDVFYNYYLLEQYYAPDGNSDQMTIDYIGPSIDTGFRLSSYSTPRKFVISIDLMYMLSCAPRPPGYFSDGLVYRYDGRHQFRGVLGGNPYPVFWIDMLHNDDLLKEEDKLNGPNSPDKDHINGFCEKFIESQEGYIIKPFIITDGDGRFSKVPDQLLEKLRRLSEDWPKRKERHEIEVRSLKGEEAPARKLAAAPDDAAIAKFTVTSRPDHGTRTRRRKPARTAPKK